MKVEYEKNSSPIYCAPSLTLSPFPHVHKELELIYVVNGNALAIADYNRVKLNAGDLFIAFPNQVHYYKNLEPGNFYIMVISPDVITGLNNELHNFIPKENVITPPPGSIIYTAIHNIFVDKPEQTTTYKAGWINLLMDSFLSQVTLAPNTSSNSSTLRNILNYCSKNFKETITLNTLAEELHINKYHISNIINRRLGLSFNDYINSLRINHACRFLQHSDSKMADISEEVGFGSIRSFNRAFYDVMNMTPSEYRNAFNKK